MNKKIIIIIILISHISNANALTLKEGLGKIFEETPSLQKAKENINIKTEEISQSFSKFLPQLSANYSIASKHTRTEANPITSAEENPINTSITLSQNLFKGGSNFAEYKKTKLKKLSELANFKKIQQDTFLNAAERYLTVLTSQEVFELSKRQVATNSEEMKRLKQRFDLGDVTIPDLKEFEARLAGYIADKEEAFGDVLAANSEFLAIFGTNAKNLIWPLLISELPENSEDAYNLAEKMNPEIIKYEYDLKAVQEKVKEMRGVFFPTITANLSWVDTNNSRYDDTSVTSASLNASLPLYTGGNNKSKYKQAVLEEKQAKNSLQQKRRDLKAKTTIAYNNILVQEERVKSFKLRAESFAITTKAIEQQKLAGDVSVIDVLDARDDEFSAEVDLKKAKQKLVLAKLELLSIVGRFTLKDLDGIFK